MRANRERKPLFIRVNNLKRIFQVKRIAVGFRNRFRTVIE